MSTISSIKQSLMLCREAGLTAFIWGQKGMGKSSLVQQICAENGWGFIDLRCSQIESADIRGLPDRSPDGRTQYLPPSDMPVGDKTFEEVAREIGKLPEDGDIEGWRKHQIKVTKMQKHLQKGILFLDEVNRAADDVLQAIFQLVIDHRIGEYVIPPGWQIVSAGNYMEGYTVSGFEDPAFLDRFVHLILEGKGSEESVREWVGYMSDRHGEYAAEVIEFATQNADQLYGKTKAELGFTVDTSPRSWESVVKVCKARERINVSESAYLDVLSGLIGNDLALTFSRSSCPVKPMQLINDGIKVHIKALKTLNRHQLTGLMWGLVSFTKTRLDDDKVGDVCMDFIDYMLNSGSEKDLVVAFARALVDSSSGSDEEKSLVIANPALAKIIAKSQKKANKGKRTFVQRLSEHPELQDALANTAMGE